MGAKGKKNKVSNEIKTGLKLTSKQLKDLEEKVKKK